MKFKEMLSRIESGEQFDLEWVTCSVQRKTGGEIKKLEGLCMKPREDEQALPKKAGGKKPSSYHRGPQHITLLHEATGRYLRVYKRLIIRFNNQEVTYG